MAIYYKSVSFHRINKTDDLDLDHKTHPSNFHFLINLPSPINVVCIPLDVLSTHLLIMLSHTQEMAFPVSDLEQETVWVLEAYLNFTLEYRVVCRQSGLLFEIGMYVVHNLKRIVCFSRQSEKIKSACSRHCL